MNKTLFYCFILYNEVNICYCLFSFFHTYKTWQSLLRLNTVSDHWWTCHRWDVRKIYTTSQLMYQSCTVDSEKKLRILQHLRKNIRQVVCKIIQVNCYCVVVVVVVFHNLNKAVHISYCCLNMFVIHVILLLVFHCTLNRDSACQEQFSYQIASALSKLALFNTVAVIYSLNQDKGRFLRTESWQIMKHMLINYQCQQGHVDVWRSGLSLDLRGGLIRICLSATHNPLNELNFTPCGYCFQDGPG